MTSLKTGPTTPGLHRLYIPAVCALIAFQGYYSQYLFNTDPDLAPGPLTRRQSITFNVLLACVWWTYYRACAVDPGRFVFPKTKADDDDDQDDRDDGPDADADLTRAYPDPDLRPASSTSTSAAAAAGTAVRRARARWCRKCSAPKPPRAHHCRHCGRCIPKMDHHCPWTGNCVSMQTFPHFLRFLLYTNLALWYLMYLVAQRVRGVWLDRRLPAYLGPSAGSLAGLAVLALADGATMVPLGVLLCTAVWGWMFNRTMIEGWEMERHEAVLARLEDDGVDGGGRERDFWGDDAVELRRRLERIEFPYDVGVFANMAQAMGTRNPLRWFLPVFGGAPVVNNETPGKGPGWEWEENGFNDLPGLWPPPDPEKLRRRAQGGWPAASSAAQQLEEYFQYQTPEEMKAAFARRQREDLLRRRRRAQALAQQAPQQSGIIAELEEVGQLRSNPARNRQAGGEEWVGEPVWTNSDGDRLWDYGVDEEVEEEIIPEAGNNDDDDDVPLAELIRRRKVLTRDDDDS